VADHAEHLAPPDVERDVVERREVVVVAASPPVTNCFSDVARSW
jgi:hypothetical protein